MAADPNCPQQYDSVQLLGFIRSEPERVVPLLMRWLEAKDNRQNVVIIALSSHRRVRSPGEIKKSGQPVFTTTPTPVGRVLPG
jgi:hypothetical protein